MEHRWSWRLFWFWSCTWSHWVMHWPFRICVPIALIKTVFPCPSILDRVDLQFYLRCALHFPARTMFARQEAHHAPQWSLFQCHVRYFMYSSNLRSLFHDYCARVKRQIRDKNFTRRNSRVDNSEKRHSTPQAVCERWVWHWRNSLFWNNLPQWLVLAHIS